MEFKVDDVICLPHLACLANHYKIEDVFSYLYNVRLIICPDRPHDAGTFYSNSSMIGFEICPKTLSAFVKAPPPIVIEKNLCKYKIPIQLPNDAPTPSAIVHEQDYVPPEIRRWMSTNFRAWPYCGIVGHDIELYAQVHEDKKRGEYYQGFLICKGCNDEYCK